MATTLALSNQTSVKRRKGFSLVELSVVVIIIGVLAAFGVPRLLQSVERSKASEAFNYLAAVRTAQERYQARLGEYSGDIALLDMTQSAPTYFTAGDITADETTWTMTLTRDGASAGYGDYTVIFTEDGYSGGTGGSSIPAAINPRGV